MLLAEEGKEACSPDPLKPACWHQVLRASLGGNPLAVERVAGGAWFSFFGLHENRGAVLHPSPVTDPWLDSGFSWLYSLPRVLLFLVRN